MCITPEEYTDNDVATAAIRLHVCRCVCCVLSCRRVPAAGIDSMTSLPTLTSTSTAVTDIC